MRKWIEARRADLMAHASDAEKAAYRIICALGYKVVRQFPISTGKKLYFADLYIPALHTVVEVDGGYHYTTKQRRLDKNRSAGLWRIGYHVIRVSNRDAYDTKKIESKLQSMKDKRQQNIKQPTKGLKKITK